MVAKAKSVPSEDRYYIRRGDQIVSRHWIIRFLAATVMLMAMSITLSDCAAPSAGEKLPTPEAYGYDYLIGPGDHLQIFVWRNPDLSQAVVVRPDGKISAPLVEDLIASGKTSTQLAHDIEGILSKYIREPLVTVMVSDFKGVYGKQIRVVGEATSPQALPYRAGMTLLDVMIAVGGLTEFAAGNRAKIVRTVNGRQREMDARVEDLVKNGDISANVSMAPGDIVIIPEAWF